MSNGELQPFVNIPIQPVIIDTPVTPTIWSIGQGDVAFKVDRQGAWFGANKYTDAPVKISMDGVISAAGVLMDDTTLDEIIDGTTYKRVLATDIQAGHIKLSETIGNLDDVDNGTTYSRVATTDIQAGHIKLDTTVNGSYSKVLTTDIQSGHIILSTVVGDLDDVDDGSTYSKTTFNDVIGAARGYNGLNSSYQIIKGYVNTVLSSVTLPANGVRIDVNGIYGRKSSVTTFYLDTNGDAYFAGTIGVSTITTPDLDGGTIDGTVITGGTVRTASSGTRVEMNTSDVARIRFYFSSTQVGYIKAVDADTLQIINDNTTGGIEYLANFHGFYSDVGGGVDVGGSVNSFIVVSGGAFKTTTGNFDLNPQGGIIYTKRMNSVSCGTYNIGGTGDRYNTIYSTTALNTGACDVADVLEVAPQYRMTRNELIEAVAEHLPDQETEIRVIDAIAKTNRHNTQRRGRPEIDEEEKENIRTAVEEQDNEKRTEMVELKRLSKIPFGTVVKFTNDGLVPSDTENDTAVAGVLSTQPGVELGGTKEGVFVALAGFVPTFVVGAGKSGDRLVSAPDGCAMPVNSSYTVPEGALIGKLIKDKNDPTKQLIDIWHK